MYVFIDSTEYRRFLSPEPEIETLRALKRLLKKTRKSGEEKLILIVTDQVIDEYYRAENQRIYESRTQHTKKEFAIKIDELTKEESVQEQSIRKKAKELQVSFEKLREKRVENFDKQIEETKTLIGELFSTATVLNCDESIFKKAETRAARGIHPRRSKEGSIGDAINWELLLGHPDNDSYVMITQDGDFLDDIGALHKTLADEWEKKHTKKLEIFPFIGKFIDSLGKAKKKSSSRTLAKKTAKTDKKKTGKKSKVDPAASAGIDAYISRSVPSVAADTDFIVSQPPSFFSAEPKVIWSDWGTSASLFGSATDEIKCCPFCQSDRSNLREEQTLTFVPNKRFVRAVCGKKFSSN